MATTKERRNNMNNLVPSKNTPARREDNGRVSSLQSDVNRLFDHFLRSLDVPMFSNIEPVWEPKIDVVDTENSIDISAELPGMKSEDVDVSFSEGLLTIKGEKKEEKEEKKKGYYVSERTYGSIQRSIHLPREVNTDKIEANFKDGVLKISVPKTEEAKAKVKKIEIKSK